MRAAPLAERFWPKVAISGAEECWEWLAGRSRSGYGTISLGRSHVPAHRVSYELHVGPIPEGLVIDHLCRNKGCVNPDHLEPVTNAENIRRGYSPHREKTHCPSGHPYSSENTYRRKNRVSRECRECQLSRLKRSRLTARMAARPSSELPEGAVRSAS